jgi:hypothetical protein
MSDQIRAIFRDMPIVDVPGRPEGMLGFMRSEVPPQYREWVDGWVQSQGGHVLEQPLIKVHGGTTPENSPSSDGFYALPPTALAEDSSED